MFEKLFKSKKNMISEKVSMPIVKQDTASNKKQIYQWIKGDNSGNVEYIKEEKLENNIHWIYFESGKRVNANLLNEYLMEVDSEDSALEIAVDEINTDPDYVPPIRKPNPVAEATFKKIIEKSTLTESPLETLLKKQSSALKTLNVKVDIKLPNKNLYKVLESSFPDENIRNVIEKVIVDSIDINYIKSSIKDSIDNLIINFYKLKEDGTDSKSNSSK